MKNLIVLLLIPFFMEGQIKTVDVKLALVGKSGTISCPVSLHKTTDRDTAVYFLRYRDCQYETIIDYKVINFLNVDNTADDLYNILISFYSEENRKNRRYSQSFKLGDKYFLCTRVSRSIKVMTGTSFFYITEKHLKELFAKM